MIDEANLTLSNKDKISLISSLSTMLSAGIPILEAVESILEGSKGNQRKVLEALRDDLAQGKHVHSSFLRFPSVFDKVTVSILKASEEAGTLEVSLRELKENIKKEIEFTDKVKGALAYPALILIVFSVVILLILAFVVPKISAVFTRLNVDLPLPTRVLIFVSNALLTYTVPILILLTMLIVLFLWVYLRRRRVFLHIFFSLPFIASLAAQIDLVRFSHSMFLLLTSGIPIALALELAKDVIMKKEVASAVAYSRELVVSGKKLSEGFLEKKDVFPPMMVKITEAGEKTGSLDKAMQDIADYLDYEVSNTLRSITTLLEPIMLIGVGVLVGGMMLAIISPIYGLIGQVGAR